MVCYHVVHAENWSGNVSRNCLWDCYWRRTGQLLANFFSCLKQQLARPSFFLFLKWRIFFYTIVSHLRFNLPVFQKVPKYTLSFPCCLLKSKIKRTLLWFSVHLSLARQNVASGFKILDIPLRLKNLMWWSTNKRGFAELYEPKNLLG